jgi:hypothetical protein
MQLPFLRDDMQSTLLAGASERLACAESSKVRLHRGRG